jgi:CheY-like chemotaxis protein
VVEDEIFIRCALGDHLRMCGMHVIEAANASEAIRVLASGADVDVVFSDVQMPGFVDGVGLAEWVVGEHPGIKVILTSGAAQRAWDTKTSHAVLPKPYDHHDLEARIRALLP